MLPKRGLEGFIFIERPGAILKMILTKERLRISKGWEFYICGQLLSYSLSNAFVDNSRLVHA